MYKHTMTGLENRKVSGKEMPLWRQLESEVQQLISTNRLKEGDELPSDRELREKFGYQKQPLARAMIELARKGILLRRPGAATLVLNRPAIMNQAEFGFTERARAVYGNDVNTRVVELTQRLPDERNLIFERRAQRALGLRAKQPMVVLSRLRLLNGVPRVLHHSYLNPRHFPSTFMKDHDFTQVSLITLITTAGFRIESRRTQLRACIAPTQVAELLQAPGQPLLEVEQELHAIRSDSANAVVIEYLHAFYLNWTYEIENRLPN